MLPWQVKCSKPSVNKQSLALPLKQLNLSILFTDDALEEIIINLKTFEHLFSPSNHFLVFVSLPWVPCLYPTSKRSCSSVLPTHLLKLLKKVPSISRSWTSAAPAPEAFSSHLPLSVFPKKRESQALPLSLLPEARTSIPPR